MGWLWEIDWPALLYPKMSVLEMLLRGTGIYVALCVLLRVVLKRQAGKIGLSDLLVVTIVAGVCRNPLVRDAYSIPDGLGVVCVVLGGSYALDWLSYYSRWVHKLLHPEPVVLVRDGAVQKDRLRRELMTESQLCSQLRRHGVADPGKVSLATMESSGEVSVLLKSKEPSPPEPAERPDCLSNGAVPRDNGAAFRANGHAPAPTSAAESDVDEFLQAADRLRDKVAWHEAQIAEHRRAVAELKGVLASRGVRWKTTPSTRGR